MSLRENFYLGPLSYTHSSLMSDAAPLGSVVSIYNDHVVFLCPLFNNSGLYGIYFRKISRKMFKFVFNRYVTL